MVLGPSTSHQVWKLDIKEAEEAADDALRNAKDAVRIAGVDRIKDDVEDSIRRSRELQRQADKLLDEDVANLEDDLNFVQGDVDKVERLNNNNQDDLDDLNRGMARLPSDLRNRLDAVEDELDRTGRKARRTKKKVDDIIDKMNNELRPKIDDLGRTVGTDMYDIGYKTKVARDNMNKIKGIIGDVGAVAGRTKQLSQNISYNLVQLKENIRQARELANNMKLSMKGDGKCVRSYRSESQPGATNEISFGFKRNDTRDNMLLVLLQKSRTEFLAVELVKNQIRFTWDNGGGQGSVTHNLTILLRLPDDPEDKKWYRVRAQRIGRIGLLKVYGVDKSESKALELSGTSPGGYSVLKLDQNSDVFFGGVNAYAEVSFPILSFVTLIEFFASGSRS